MSFESYEKAGMAALGYWLGYHNMHFVMFKPRRPGYPDCLVVTPDSATFYEFKTTTTKLKPSRSLYTQLQIEKFKELIKKGFKIRLVFQNPRVRKGFELYSLSSSLNAAYLLNLTKQVKGAKP